MTRTLSKKESQTQADARDYAKIRGWLAIKVTTPSKNGWPDFYYLRRGRHVWVEWKKFGEEPDPHQIERIREIKEHGGEVYVFDNLEDFKKVMR